MTNRDALIAAIHQFPGDDTPRLMLADWHAEHGEPDRAELASLQREIARNRCVMCGSRGVMNYVYSTAPCGWCEHLTPKRTHESAILAANPHWLPKCPVCEGEGTAPTLYHHAAPCYACTTTGDAPIGTGRAAVTWRTGFVDAVRVPTMRHVLRQLRSYEQASDNPVNLGDWLPTPWARDLVRGWPTVRRIVVEDGEAYRAMSGEGSWRRDDGSPVAERYRRQLLPSIVFDALKGGNRTDPDLHFYKTPDEAREALSLAVCAVVRGLCAKECVA